MGEILNLGNLRSYASPGYRDRLPDWRVADMLHVRLPVLAYRDYATDYADGEWPLCWNNKRHVIAALRMTITLLKPWQATRRRGGADRILKRLEPEFPALVFRVQGTLSRHSTKWFKSVSPKSKAASEIVQEMSQAVQDVAHIVKTNSKHASMTPMLGSKIFSFFFPDFFPIWDTAWVKSALVAPPNDVADEAETVEMMNVSTDCARRYASYVKLMISDAWNTTAAEYNRLRSMCFSLCARDGYDGARHVLDHFYHDSLPVLFEACLLGRAARMGQM